MLLMIPIALVIIPVTIMLAIRVNRRSTVAHTILCVVLTYLFGRFAWIDWRAWQTVSGNAAEHHAIMFALSCVLFAVMLIALGRRLWWLRHHHHDAWIRGSQ